MWVVCTNCGTGAEADDAVVAAKLKTGEIRSDAIEHYDHTQIRHLGECEICLGKRQVVIEAIPYVRGNVVQEQADITRRMSELQKAHPDWARERCSTQAVEDHNSIECEENEAFRTYLIEHRGL